MCKFTKLFVLMLTGLVLSVHVLVAGDSSIKWEEVVAKHLTSIGSTSALTSSKSRVVQGRVHFTLEPSGTSTQDGKLTLASEGDKLHFYIGLPNPSYKGERFIFDGSKIYVSEIKPGSRSALGAFIQVQDRILREGLWGGALSSDWALLRADQRKAKISYAGLKKVEGRQLHQLRYVPAKGSDLTIALYFDPETFHHVLTTYTLTISPHISTTDVESAGAKETNYRLEERFSDFKEFDSMTLPTQWEIRFTEDIPVSPEHPGAAGVYGRSSTMVWSSTADAISNNVTLDPRNFQVK